MKTYEIKFLPSGKKARKGNIVHFGGKLIIASSVLHLAKESYHIYIISDDEIKNIDDYYCKVTNEIHKPYDKSDLKYLNFDTNKSKVHATTDEMVCGNKDNFVRQIHMLSMSFIQNFVNMYNDGVLITNVDVNYNITEKTTI